MVEAEVFELDDQSNFGEHFPDGGSRGTVESLGCGSQLEDFEGTDSAGSRKEAGCATLPRASGLSRANFDVEKSVEVAWQSLNQNQVKLPWEQGVWNRIFGTESFPCSFGADIFARPQQPFYDASDSSGVEEEARLGAAYKKHKADPSLFKAVVKDVKPVCWKEERECLFQRAINKWLDIILSMPAGVEVCIHLNELDDLEQQRQMLSDLFAKKAPSTLVKRANSVFGIVAGLADIGAVFPCDESAFYAFLTRGRADGSSAAKRKSFMESVAFCHYVLGIQELLPIVRSRRCLGTTVAPLGTVIKQASPLRVRELVALHEVVMDASDLWDAVFAGAALFAIYARGRWMDCQQIEELLLDRDFDCNLQYVEGAAGVHKTARASLFKHTFLALTAPVAGVRADGWAEKWIDCRDKLGIRKPPHMPLMPAPDRLGCPTVRPLSSQEAGKWLRALLDKKGLQVEDRKLTSHSFKCTLLSYAAKRGLTLDDRLALGYHSGSSMVHRYSRDAMARPLAQLSAMLLEIRTGCFDPDATRSGRILKPCEVTHPEGTFAPGADFEGPGATQQPSSGVSSFVLVDDTVEPALEQAEVVESERSPAMPLQAAVAGEPEEQQGSSSSSGEESEDVVPAKSVVVPRPVAPPGTEMVRHVKLRTVHLAFEGFKRILVCGRAIGPDHEFNPEVRWDFAKCKQCFKSSLLES